MRLSLCALLLAAFAGAVSGAHGDIIFSNVSISGLLATGASYETGPVDIDFILPDAIVGDSVDPRREGDLLISYEAESTDPEVVKDTLAALSFSGVSGDLTLDENHNPVKSAVVLQVADGEIGFKETVSP